MCASVRQSHHPIAVLGGGLSGCLTALALTRAGLQVDLYEQAGRLIDRASLYNEGKLHLGYVYALDQSGQTYRRMIEGSLSFLPILKDLCDDREIPVRTSSPFIYGVMGDSQISPEAFLAHAHQVDTLIEASLDGRDPSASGLDYRPTQDVTEACLGRSLNRSELQAAFQTPEISVDPFQIADRVRRAVDRATGLHTRLNCHVSAIETLSDRGFRVRFRSETGADAQTYSIVVNALWEDQTRLNEQAGLPAPFPQLLRYKAALLVELDGQDTRNLPSSTFVTGPYGDVVNHGGRSLYLSWYPACRLGSVPISLRETLDRLMADTDPQTIIQDSLARLGELVPGLAALGLRPEQVKLGGGYILARGESDIDDPDSGLHQRHEFGIRAEGGWISLDTGKYCMAPMLALEACDTVLERLA